MFVNQKQIEVIDRLVAKRRKCNGQSLSGMKEASEKRSSFMKWIECSHFRNLEFKMIRKTWRDKMWKDLKKYHVGDWREEEKLCCWGDLRLVVNRHCNLVYHMNQIACKNKGLDRVQEICRSQGSQWTSQGYQPWRKLPRTITNKEPRLNHALYLMFQWGKLSNRDIKCRRRPECFFWALPCIYWREFKIKMKSISA